MLPLRLPAKRYLGLTSKHRLAYVAAVVALVMPGGSVVIGALWLYRHLRVQSRD